MTAPTMRPDGSILAQPGYDRSTAIYLSPSVDVSVPEKPTLEDALRAVAMLLDLLCQFPATAAGKAAWLATLLHVVVRPAINGPVPMLIVSGTVAGTGKGLATDVLSEIALRVPAAKGIYSGVDAETRKLFTSVLMVGDPLIVLDNIEAELGDQALDKVLTDLIWTDRILGESERVSLPVRLAVLATGNGISIRADLRRRAQLMQLSATVEHPEERGGWKYPRLLDHVREHRGELLSAALTIVRAYHVAGRPDMKLRPMGSYEAWSDLVRSALVWAACADPCDTVADIRAADARTAALKAMVASWPVTNAETVTANELLERAGAGSEWRAALAEWCPPRPGSDLPTPVALGRALRSIRGRIVDGRVIDGAGHGRLGQQWVRLPAGRDDVTTVTTSLTYAREERCVETESSCESESPSSRRHEEVVR